MKAKKNVSKKRKAKDELDVDSPTKWGLSGNPFGPLPKLKWME